MGEPTVDPEDLAGHPARGRVEQSGEGGRTVVMVGIVWVVRPPMVIELATGAALAWRPGGMVAALLVRQLA